MGEYGGKSTLIKGASGAYLTDGEKHKGAGSMRREDRGSLAAGIGVIYQEIAAGDERG